MAWWPFKRRAAPTPPETPQSPAGGDSVEDWAVGDLAECVDDQWFFRTTLGWFPSNGPSKGDVERVTNVIIAGETQFLAFTRYGRMQVFAAAQFRKITPKADALERADADFIEQIKPKVVS